MTLFCDTVRMALLIDEVPRKELPNVSRALVPDPQSTTLRRSQ